MDVARLRTPIDSPPRGTRALGATLAAVWLVGCSLLAPTTATSFLTQIEKSPDPNERFKAYQSLASPRCYDDAAQKARAAQTLITRLEPGKEPLATRAVICRTLGAIGDPAAREPMIRLIRDPDPLIRVEACKTLGKIGRAEDATVLMQAMTLDTNADCQIAAIESLGLLKTQDPRTATYLVHAMEHDDPAIRLAALQSLRKITGKDLGVKPEPWREMIVGRNAKPASTAGTAPKDGATTPASTGPTPLSPR